MYQHNTDYINAINMLRATAGTNPEHNRHIQQIVQCLTDAFIANNHAYDMWITELRHMLKRQQAEIDELKRIVQTGENQTPPPTTPIAADIFFTPKSIKKAKNDLLRYLN